MSPATPTQANAPGKRLHLTIPNKSELYRSYLSFCQHGGLFVPTDEDFVMGDEVLLIVNLPEQETPSYLHTNVAWINSTHNASGQAKGIGLAFANTESAIATRETIEYLLSGLLLNQRPTYTM